jgi:hypothetical protein
MRAKCQISKGGQQGHQISATPCSRYWEPVLAFPTDPKALSGLRKPYVRSPYPHVLKSFAFGQGRAFSEVRAHLEVFHPEAARRDL